MVKAVNLDKATGAVASRAATYVWGPDLGSRGDARGNWQRAGGVGGLLMVLGTATATDYFPLHDRMGNIVGYRRADVSPNASTDYNRLSQHGAVYDYDAFGREVRSAGPAADSIPFHFSSKFTDAETGLNYYGYRFYDPVAGRWLNRDPIGERGGVNVYGMVGNDPVNKLDRLGLAPKAVACGGTCGASVDDWFLEELLAQFRGYSAWKSKQSGSVGISEYLQWANGNQRYKDDKFFEFSKGTKCGTRASSSAPGCGRSVTLCGKCVRSAILGNLVYGIVGRYAGFSDTDLNKASSTNSLLKNPPPRANSPACSSSARTDLSRRNCGSWRESCPRRRPTPFTGA